MKSVRLRSEEKIIAEVRNHWLIFLIESLVAMVATIGPATIVYLYIILAKISFSLSLFYLLVFIYLFWLVFVWTYFFLAWTDYYLDTWIITDKKITIIKQDGLFHRKVSSFHLDRIQDITIDIQGFIATTLRFGRLHIQTAVDSRDFFLDFAVNPEEIKNLISKLIDKIQNDKNED
jgi:uncharacterized membrane protein YdbT with pleckstrin-like domain